MCSKPFLSDSTNINDTDTYAVRSNSNFITYLLCNCRFCWYRQKKRKVYDGYRYKLLWNFQVISDVFIYLKGGGAWQKRQLVCLLIMVSRDAHLLTMVSRDVHLLIMVSRDAHLLIMMSKDAHLLIMVSKDAHLWLVFWSCPSVERTSFCPQLIYRIYISVFVPNWYTVYVYISPHICTLIVHCTGCQTSQDQRSSVKTMAKTCSISRQFEYSSLYIIL